MTFEKWYARSRAAFEKWFARRQENLKPFPVAPSAYYSEEEWRLALWKWWLEK
jgi:hypothetical protein